jgi:cohesin loading factor subunit SCC2
VQQHVGNAIYERLHDSSTAPRDAAVDLIGKYVVQRSEWANQYFPIISSLISDKGLSVRKRVVKLLRDMCAVADEQETRVKICAKLVVATQDEEDSIKDLALKSLTEILFPTPFVPDQSADLLVDILEQTRGTDERLEQALEGVG